ncbi:hypothetical protein WAF17_15615 [Bernardetia sp. ABR2-2B]|uniref:hypothetical protein n=1 Tax=Bernardetia sp. ABR2-2B TaxID=3127472 RepID=UPI0030D3FA26
MRTLFITLFFAFFASFFISSSLKAQDWDDNENETTTETVTEIEVAVTLFAKANFEGESFKIEELISFDNQTLAEEFGKTISSIKVNEGVVVRIYMSDDFEGESFEITSDIKTLPAKWVGKVRSLEVVVAEQGGSDEGW